MRVRWAIHGRLHVEEFESRADLDVLSREVVDRIILQAADLRHDGGLLTRVTESLIEGLTRDGEELSLGELCPER